MSIITSGLLSPLVVTWGYSGEPPPERTISPGILGLDIVNYVTTTDKYVPLTGLYATEANIGGWIWDKRRLENWSDVKTRYNSFLGGHKAGLRDGTILSDWQSGTVSGTDYLDIAHFRTRDSVTWTPRVRAGKYSAYFDERPLYSDYSFSINVDRNNNQNLVNVVELRDDAAHSTVHVALYKREDDFSIIQQREFQFVDRFTGKISGTTRLPTEDSNANILWDNLDDRKYEFIIRGNKLYLNQDYFISVGKLDRSLTDPTVYQLIIEELLEFKGKATSGRQVFTRYFPLQKGSVQVVLMDAAGNREVWEEVSTLNFSGPQDKHFSVDHDLGIITLGGFQAPSLILEQDLDEFDTEVPCFIDDKAFADYPQQGIIKIDSEEILYLGKTRNRFTDCLRGYNGTTPTSHTRGSLVEDIQHGARSNDDIYIAYTAVPRVDYEVTSYDVRSANKTPWLDIRPGVNVETDDILQIVPADINLGEIILETDAELIGGNLYGPMFYGTDFTKLTARALDSAGNPVEGINLTIEIFKGGGKLNAQLGAVTATSNTLGEVYAHFNWPFSEDDIEQRVTSVVYSGADTIFEVPSLNGDVIASDSWVFQILKHDAFTGRTGLISTIDSVSTVASEYGKGSVVVDAVLQDKYSRGFVYIVDTSGVKQFAKILRKYPATTVAGIPGTQLMLDREPPTGVAGNRIFIFSLQDIEWDPNILNGTRVILYEFSQDALHPITNEPGAYIPLRPDSVSGTQLLFKNRQLAIPKPLDEDVNLGGYVIVSSNIASLRAYGTDPISGRVIFSNTIRLSVKLPNSLVGVDSSGALPIPHGWQLVTEQFNFGTGIGGANFLTVNQQAEGINQFTLTTEF